MPSESKCDDGVRPLVQTAPAGAELSCHRWSWAAWVAVVRHDPPDAQPGQWAAATRALLWEVPEFDHVRFCSPCTGQWWQVRFGVCWGRCIILWAMEHNTLSENAFQGNLGAESSCAIECCTSYCSDGLFFLLVVTLSCNIILIWGLKKKKLQGCSRRSRRIIWKKCNFIPIIFCHWIMLAEKLLSMPIRISLQVNLQNKVILGKSGRNSLLAGVPVPQLLTFGSSHVNNRGLVSALPAEVVNLHNCVRKEWFFAVWKHRAYWVLVYLV